MEAAKEFLSTISHEIRTPLTSIKGFSKTILDSYDNLTDEQKKKFINIIHEQSKRLINLVENALTAADSVEKYNNFVFKKVDINQILTKSIDLVKINYKNINYKVNLAPSMFSPLDSDKLEQIFVNILDNASKYSINSNTVEIKTFLKEGKTNVSIKNFGSVIEDDKKDKIFEKFYRIENHLTAHAQGSGLGLYIVKMLTEKMKGEIKVDSGDKNVPYVEFTITFPLFNVEDFTSHKNGGENV